MIQLRFALYIVVCLSCSSLLQQTAIAQRGRPSLKKVVDEAVGKELERQNLVGVSVGIISRKRVVYSNGYGFADIEAGIPFSEDTVANWESNSKPVMAVLAMQLVFGLVLSEPTQILWQLEPSFFAQPSTAL